MNIIAKPSPNFDSRKGEDVTFLILHYTGMKTAQEALDRLCDAEVEVSAHYTVDEEGSVYHHVDEAKRAWHAGVSSWRGQGNINAKSIGIEIVNMGRIGFWPHEDAPLEDDFLGALAKIGYDVTDENAALIAFQRHYVPEVFDAKTQGEVCDLTRKRLSGFV